MTPSGLAIHEISHRETFDVDTGELIGVTKNCATCKARCEELPPPVPRRLRIVFHFARTAAKVPAELLVLEDRGT